MCKNAFRVGKSEKPIVDPGPDTCNYCDMFVTFGFSVLQSYKEIN